MTGVDLVYGCICHSVCLSGIAANHCLTLTFLIRRLAPPEVQVVATAASTDFQSVRIMVYQLEQSDRDMIYEAKRLATFKKWRITSGPLSAVNMAKAGFYSSSNDPKSDCVRCFCCFHDLEGWDDDDDPWHEHKKREKCLFAKLETEEKNLTASQKVQIMEERLRNLNEERRRNSEKVKDRIEEIFGDD